MHLVIIIAIAIIIAPVVIAAAGIALYALVALIPTGLTVAMILIIAKQGITPETLFGLLLGVATLALQAHHSKWRC